MSITRKLITCAALACAALGILTAAAAATSTLLAYPGGGITAASSGNITLTSGTGIIECPLTLRGTLATLAEGTLTASPEPLTNPHAGTVTGGSVGRCSSGTVTLLFPAEPRWDIYAYSYSSGRVGLFIPHAQLLIEAFVFARCLISAGLKLSYDSSTGRMEIVGLTEIVTRALASGICPERPGLIGRFAIEPRQAVFEAADERLECNEEFNAGQVVFETINPGGISTRRLTCKNISLNGAVLRVVAGSRIEGAFAARFEERNVPAVGEVLMLNDIRTITLRFIPEPEAEARTRWGASFKLAFLGKAFFTNMTGGTR